MSLNAIQAFLEKFDSVLKNYTVEVEGVVKSAAQIIYDAAQEHFISPKFILTKLDHEQCLIRGCSFLQEPQKLQKALDWAAGFGVCTGCDLTNPKIAKYKGFANQVDAVASVQNDYIRKAGTVPYVYTKGQSIKTRDSQTVIPENQATANLYTYTPYKGGDGGKIGGNYFFAKLWNKYWAKKLYPDGTILKDSAGSFWLVDGGEKRRYSSEGIYLSSQSFDDAITVSQAVLDEYTEGAEIKFSNYSLVKDENSNIYLLVDNRKRKIEDEETFRQLGFNPEEVVNVLSVEIEDYVDAVPITKTSIFPQGALVSGPENKLYWVQNGLKHLVYPAVAVINYSSLSPIVIAQEDLNAYYPGEPQKIKDGKLVKSPHGEMYFVSHGALRLVPSQADFLILFGEAKLGYVIEVPDEVIAFHPKSELLQAQDSPAIYQTIWVSADGPQEVTVGQSYDFKIKLKNKSSRAWAPGEVYLQAEELGKKVSNTEIVPVDAEFTFTAQVILITATTDILTFKLYTKGNVYIKGGFYQTEVKVRPVSTVSQNKTKDTKNEETPVEAKNYQAKIISHNLPQVLKSSTPPAIIEVKIKNTGSKPWLRRKTGLKFLNSQVKLSPFYDANDWVSREIASVSVEPFREQIKPQETGIYKFTLRVNGLPSGQYSYKIALWLNDGTKKGQLIKLDGNEFLSGTVRVR